ncbi:hypothetical protein V8G61_03225 [Gaetbulibacter sp. M240]|uniref:hypothetical protein n=1 Tax=Gaetbulibacter sp. M240 TaxID=3126511 RepID=UPI00374F8F30
MGKLKVILKRIFFPITLLTIITVASVYIAGNALYIWITHGGESAIYPAITIPIMVFFICLYVFDRWLIKRVAYVKIMVGEGLIIVGVLFLFVFQNKTIDVRFETNEDYVVVIFDAQENSLSRFSDKGVFGKELIHKSNVLHLDATMGDRKDLRILGPENWSGFVQNQGVFKSGSDSVPYLIIMKHHLDTRSWKPNQVFIDSLIAKERIR